jgi:hypothetical protein
MRSGACMLDTYMRIASTHILLDRILSQMTWAAQWSDAAFTARHRSPRDLARQHPCWLAASFLPCARPPDALNFCLASTDHVDDWDKESATAPTIGPLSQPALDWIPCLATITLQRPAPTPVPPAPHKVLLAIWALFPALHFLRRLKPQPISARHSPQHLQNGAVTCSTLPPLTPGWPRGN